MATECRSWWRNAAVRTDAEMAAIDRLADDLAPLAPPIVEIRELISSLEPCHHKADHWGDSIIAAIADGRSLPWMALPGYPPEGHPWGSNRSSWLDAITPSAGSWIPEAISRHLSRLTDGNGWRGWRSVVL